MSGNLFLEHWIERLRLQNRIVKLTVVILCDLILLLISIILAHMLRVSSFEIPQTSKLPLYFLGPFLSVISAACFGVYGSVSRTYTTDLEYKIVRSQLFVPPIWATVIWYNGSYGFARSAVLIYFLLAISAMIVVRKLTSKLLATTSVRIKKIERIPVIVYGAGREGAALVEGLRRQNRYLPVALLDDDNTLTNRTVAGLKVHKSEDLQHMLARYKAREIFVAKQTENRAARRALVESFIAHGLDVKTIPDISELAVDSTSITSLRPVKLEDLLGRDPVPPDTALMQKSVKGQVVLVTGAGGSIGSELVRQTAAFAPKCIVMLDNSEFSLFEINREMEKRSYKNATDRPKFVAVLADITDANKIGSLLNEHNVSVVLHAAAYKHVRMIQENALAGIRNNVFGTQVVAEAAIHHGVSLFVLVSTDKAVRPTSVMGASKRAAELIVQNLANRKDHSTVMSIVRFGNVLGSTGSVVPLFREQIARGGPVLVTHPEVTRYFMLIPEAAQLVIQASAIAKGGEVFVLDMGESVKIIDLARTMIELAGLTIRSQNNPNGDIEIIYSGLLKGEKLYEELQIGNNLEKTVNARISRSDEPRLTTRQLNLRLKQLSRAIDKNDEKSALDSIFNLAQFGSSQQTNS